MIIPSILAFTCLGPSTYLYCSLSNSHVLSLAAWLAGVAAVQGNLAGATWGNDLVLASLSMSMTVNALATGFIVFRIFKVFRGVKVTSDDRILGSTHGSKLRSIIFVTIESGMALFSIQLARFIMNTIDLETAGTGVLNALQLIPLIHQQLNVIIRLVIIHFILLITWLG